MHLWSWQSAEQSFNQQQDLQTKAIYHKFESLSYCDRGSGQIIDQGARLVDIALENGNAFNGNGWKYISDAFKKNTVHFIGLLSDGGVHSRYDQLAAFLRGAQKSGAKKICVHILTVYLHPSCNKISVNSVHLPLSSDFPTRQLTALCIVIACSLAALVKQWGRLSAVW